MKIGTRSVLYGAHCWLIHPWFVALAWRKLYGFPWDPRLWLAFFVHDLGYIGKPNMDGPEGETHVLLGARIMSRLFDPALPRRDWEHVGIAHRDRPTEWFGKWGQLCLLHSRYYAKGAMAPPSKLCFADKLSFALTPRWLYLPLVSATGELAEYLQRAQTADSAYWKPTGDDAKAWHAQLCSYMRDWVATHKDGAADTWTSSNRHGAKA